MTKKSTASLKKQFFDNCNLITDCTDTESVVQGLLEAAKEPSLLADLERQYEVDFKTMLEWATQAENS